MAAYSPLFKNDKPHFHTSGGELAVGYGIYTYYAGTNTPVAMFSDPAGTTQYQNPIVLDSRGEPSGQGIYASVAHTYKIVLKDSLGALVWSMDDVSPMGVGDITVEGIDLVVHDRTLAGEGTPESPLGVVLPIKVQVFYDNDPSMTSSFSGITFDDLNAAIESNKMVFIVKSGSIYGQIYNYMQLYHTGGGHMGAPLTYSFYDIYHKREYKATQDSSSSTGLTWTYMNE